MCNIEVVLHFGGCDFVTSCHTASEAMDAVRETYEAIFGRVMTYDERDELMKRTISICYGRMTETEMLGITVRRAKE